MSRKCFLSLSIHDFVYPTTLDKLTLGKSVVAACLFQVPKTLMTGIGTFGFPKDISSLVSQLNLCDYLNQILVRYLHSRYPRTLLLHRRIFDKPWTGSSSYDMKHTEILGALMTFWPVVSYQILPPYASTQ